MKTENAHRASVGNNPMNRSRGHRAARPNRDVQREVTGRNRGRSGSEHSAHTGRETGNDDVIRGAAQVSSRARIPEVLALSNPVVAARSALDHLDNAKEATEVAINAGHLSVDGVGGPGFSILRDLVADVANGREVQYTGITSRPGVRNLDQNIRENGFARAAVDFISDFSPTHDVVRGVVNRLVD